MNICKRQTFIGKKYLTFKKKYLRILPMYLNHKAMYPKILAI